MAMKLALPKFQFRFVSSMGNVVHPGNFHPVGTQRVADTLLERAVQGAPESKPGGVWLIVGGSGGFGSAARAVLGGRFGADTLNLSFDAVPNPASNNKIRKLGSPGFHRNLALERGLRARGVKARSLVGDAFDPQVREEVIEDIRANFDGKINGIVWALAAPRATDTRSGKVIKSALRPLGQAVQIKNFSGIDERAGEPSRIGELEIPPGSPEEAINTIFVMGGGVVRRWMNALLAADVLAEGCTLATISYRGNPLNEGVYRNGLIGLAKADLEFETAALHSVLEQRLGGRAFAVEGPAVITEASGGIPGVPFYMAHLLDVMGDNFEDPLTSMRRLFETHFSESGLQADEEGLVRMDDRELVQAVQEPLAERFTAAKPGDEFAESLYRGFMAGYGRTRGFSVEGVDYAAQFDTDEVCS